MSEEHGPDLFPTTAWTLLRAAQRSANAPRSDERNQFLTRYVKPVFVYLRARGRSPEQAEELTQEFFLRFLDGDGLRTVDAQKGGFRPFLLTALKRFVADQTPDRLRRQEFFERQYLSLNGLLTEEERCREPSTDDSPEGPFLRQWAIDRIAEVRRRLKELCVKKDRAVWFDLFEAVHAAEPDAEVPSQEELARRVGMTRDQVRHALEQTQQWFRTLLRREVRDHVESDEEVGEEIRDLLMILKR